jgi:hypothetical protein
MELLTEATMLRYIITSLLSGALFGLMDGFINGNPLARKLYAIYEPISRSSINIIAGLIVDLAYGFIIAGVFLLFYRSLPGKSRLLKGVTFSLIIWFFRVVMQVTSQGIMFRIPVLTLLYTLCAGLLEMLILGIVYGFALGRS